MKITRTFLENIRTFDNVNTQNKTVKLSHTYTGMQNSPFFLSDQEISPQYSEVSNEHLPAKNCQLQWNLQTSSAHDDCCTA